MNLRDPDWRDEESKKSKIEQAQDVLYKRDAPAVTSTHEKFEYEKPRSTDEDSSPTPEWNSQYAKAHILDSDEATDKAGSFFRKLFVGSLIFFVIAILVSAGIYIYGNNVISPKNILIDISSPPSIASSDTLSFDVHLQNGNNADLTKSTIIINYPEGTREIGEGDRPLVTERVDIGTLGKGQVAQQTFTARLFGEENSTKQIRITYEYQVGGSDVIFSKDQTFDVGLRLAPIVLSVVGLNEVNNNQEITLVARVLSNSNNTLQNVVLNVTYPFGFTYAESSEEVESGTRGEFYIGELLPNGSKEIIIKGNISGQSEEDKVFKFTVGTSNSASDNRVSIPLVSFFQEMVVRGDFLATSISFNENAGSIRAEESFRGVISWKNTLGVPLNDADFSLSVSGNLLDEENVIIEKGFYDSNTQIASWNKNTDPLFATLSPGSQGQLRFSVPINKYADAIARSITNPSVNLTLNISARRLTDNNVTETIRSSFSKRIPILTSVLVDSKSLYSTGPLKNIGPIPPKAQQKTTYTATIALSNSINNISGGEVIAILPVHTTYEEEFSPQSDKVSWNPNTRQLRWEVGTLRARTGYGSVPRTLSFKVGLSPSQTQIGTSPNLVENIIFTGKDDFAGVTLRATSPNITTAAKDPGFVFSHDKVVQ